MIIPDWEYLDAESMQNDRDELIALEKENNPYDEHRNPVIVPSDGFQVTDGQYIIDPDYAELMRIDNFEDLVVNKK